MCWPHCIAPCRYLKPVFSVYEDLHHFLEALASDLVDVQRQTGAFQDRFHVEADAGCRLDSIKRDFQYQYHYELNNLSLGIGSFRTLVDTFADTVMTKSKQQQNVFVHPSPVFHLRLLLKHLVDKLPQPYGMFTQPYVLTWPCLCVCSHSGGFTLADRGTLCSLLLAACC